MRTFINASSRRMSFSYDALNRVVKTTDALGFCMSNEFNEIGWLVARVDQLARPLVETDAAGIATRWFVWANGRLLAQVGSDSIVRVAHFDELGRLVAFTDDSGDLTDEYAYQPYGRLVGHSGTTDTPFTWLGAYGVWYAGNGLYIARHRAYDANLMRFVQTDPIGLMGGDNLYAYADDNPAFLVDALGLQSSGGGVVFIPGPSGLTMQNVGPVRPSWVESGYSPSVPDSFWKGYGGFVKQANKGLEAAENTGEALVGLGVTFGLYPASAVEITMMSRASEPFAQAQAAQDELKIKYGGAIAGATGQALSQNPSASSARVAVVPDSGQAFVADQGPAFYPANTRFVTVSSGVRKPM